jgi:hypothetical protein
MPQMAYDRPAMDEIQPPQSASRAERRGRAVAWKLLAVAGLYWLGLVLITHWPGSLMPRFRLPFVSADKLVHFAIFCGLSFLVSAAAAIWFRPSWTSRLAVFGALALYAALDELTQAFVPLREPSVKDWFADVAGAAAGMALFTFFYWQRKHIGEREASASR